MCALRFAAASSGALRAVVCVGLMFFAVVGCVRAAAIPTDSTIRPLVMHDTSARDSTRHDSVPPPRSYVPLRLLGSVGDTPFITKRVLLENVVNQTSEAVERDAHVYPLLLGAPGQNDELLIDGLDTRNVAVMIAGRPVNNPVSGRFSFLHVAPEFFEDAEITHGPRAMIMGFSATDAAINFVPRILNANRPLVHIRYYQGSYDHLASDLAFSQNVSRSINVNIGIDRQSQLGEFRNNELQYWNLRGGVRWFADSTFNVLLTENFTHAHAGVNGGVYLHDIDNSNTLVGVNLSLADAEDIRHDVTLTGLYRNPRDTAMQSHLSVYHSTLHREYYVHPDIFGNPIPSPFAVTSQGNTSRWVGLDGRQEWGFDGTKLRVGVSLEAPSADSSANLRAYAETFAGVYGLVEKTIGGRLTIGAFGRGDLIGKAFRPTIGADATLAIVDGLTLVAGAARTERVPTWQERWWTSSSLQGLLTSGLSTTSLNEIHTVVTAGMHLTSTPVTFNIDLASRLITRPVEAAPHDSTMQLFQGDSRRVLTLATQLGVHIGNFSAEGNVLYTIEQEGGAQLQRFPVLYARGGIYFSHPRFLGVPLGVHAGIEGMGMTSFTGETYLPGEQFFVPGSTVRSGIDGTMGWICMLHIGDAYLRLGMHNLLNRRVYYTPYYPITGRTFFLGVTWALFD